MGLKQAIKHRQSDKFNVNFFNNKADNNFIPLAEKQMNFDNGYNTNAGYYNQQQNNNQQHNYYWEQQNTIEKLLGLIFLIIILSMFFVSSNLF